MVKINGDDIELTLSEDDLKAVQAHDVNPLIYYRINKPLAADVKLPIFDLKLFYSQSLKYGFNIETIPDTSYVINDKLISLTKDDYESLG